MRNIDIQNCLTRITNIARTLDPRTMSNDTPLGELQGDLRKLAMIANAGVIMIDYALENGETLLGSLNPDEP